MKRFAACCFIGPSSKSRRRTKPLKQKDHLQVKPLPVFVSPLSLSTSDFNAYFLFVLLLNSFLCCYTRNLKKLWKTHKTTMQAMLNLRWVYLIFPQFVSYCIRLPSVHKLMVLWSFVYNRKPEKFRSSHNQEMQTILILRWISLSICLIGYQNS